MTHTIELSPRADRRLSDKARRAGLTIEKYLSRIAEREAEAMEPIEEAAAQMSDEQKRDIAARLAAVGEFTRAAHELSGGAAAHTGSWNREEIYEGDAERVLGIREAA
jgi:hypothetical protein